MKNCNFRPTNDYVIHVLHITSGDLWAGAETMLLTLAKALRDNLNTKVSIVIFNPGILEKKLRELNFPIHLISETDCNSLKMLRHLNKVIAQTKPDVIHTHRLKENILGSIASWTNNKTPCIQTLHGRYEHEAPWYKPNKYLKQLMDRLVTCYYQRYVIAVSPAMETELQSILHKSKIKMIANGIDTAQFSPNDQLPTHKNNESIYHFGIAGRLMPVKRVDIFIECALYLKQQYPDFNIHFHIYGEGPLQESLKSQATNAENFIHFEGHCEDISTQLKQLDALLMTSDHEGLPMILLEAMCLGVPVICHAVGGIPYLLEYGKNGTLIEQQSPISFANAIIKLIKQPKEHRQLTKHAFKNIQQNYSAKQTAAAYLKIYLSLQQ